jgi:hypothetical protein
MSLSIAETIRLTGDPAVCSTDLLFELETELRRQDEFIQMLHGWTALPHIIGGAQREKGRILAAIESERNRSSNDKLTGG